MQRALRSVYLALSALKVLRSHPVWGKHFTVKQTRIHIQTPTLPRVTVDVSVHAPRLSQDSGIDLAECLCKD